MSHSAAFPSARGQPGAHGSGLCVPSTLLRIVSCLSLPPRRVPGSQGQGSRADGLHAAGTEGTRPGRRDWQAWYPGPRCSLNMDGSPVGTETGPDPERRRIRTPPADARAGTEQGVRVAGPLHPDSARPPPRGRHFQPTAEKTRARSGAIVTDGTRPVHTDTLLCLRRLSPRDADGSAMPGDTLKAKGLQTPQVPSAKRPVWSLQSHCRQSQFKALRSPAVKNPVFVSAST